MARDDMTNLKNDLVGAFHTGNLDRRGFLAGAASMGVSLTAAQTLLPKQAMAAKKGGRFRMGINDGATNDSLDPQTTSSMFMIVQNHSTRNYLSEIAPDNTLVPELAESWEASDGATHWRFKLRKGVEFHNGKTMTASDVVDSINSHRGESSSSPAKSLLAAIKEIKKDGDNDFSVTLESANADFPYLFTDYHVNILPSDGDGNVEWQSGVGTGAYVLKEFEPGIRSLLERNPNYWKEGRAHFDEAELLLLADANARQTALRTGDVDAIDQPELRTVGRMAELDEVEVDNVTSWAHTSLPMHMNVAPFDNPDVRLAMKFGIDRDEIVDKVLTGYGTVGNDHPISPVIQYYSELEQRTYDPDRAKHHLKKAGMEELSVSLHTSDAGGAGNVDTAILYKEHAKKAGININVVKEPGDGYWSDVWNVKPFCTVNWGGRPTADVMFTTAYAEGAPWNDSKFSHERFNELLVAARGETDKNLRAEMYREMQIILKDEGSAVIPAFRNLVYLRSTKVQHGPGLSANWQFDGARAVERWWFA